jgi:outer membrane protein TolC
MAARAGPMRLLRGLACTAATAALIVGCALGPDFRSPGPPDVKGSGYTPEPLTDTASADVLGGAAQRFVKDEDIPGQWWELFHSPPLNQLIERALTYN